MLLVDQRAYERVHGLAKALDRWPSVLERFEATTVAAAPAQRDEQADQRSALSAAYAGHLRAAGRDEEAYAAIAAGFTEALSFWTDLKPEQLSRSANLLRYAEKIGRLEEAWPSVEPLVSRILRAPPAKSLEECLAWCVLAQRRTGRREAARAFLVEALKRLPDSTWLRELSEEE